MPTPDTRMTLLLRQLRSGDRSAAERVAALVVPELRKLAAACLRAERPGHVLQPTALVHEAFMRLVAHADHNWENRAHFFGAAARTMRRILVDYSRKRPRGEAVALEEALKRFTVRPPPIDLLALDEALVALDRLSPQQARIVELRYFVGLTIPEIAEVLGCSPRTVNTHWAAARSWLRERLSA